MSGRRSGRGGRLLGFVSYSVGAAALFSPTSMCNTGKRNVQLNFHYVSASHEYLQAVANGWGWGLIPELQALTFHGSRTLVSLGADLMADVELYWHQWRVKSKVARELGATIVKEGRKRLRQ